MSAIPKDLPANVLAIVLYGSRARGDADTLSDTDVGVFVANCTFDELLKLRDWAGRTLGGPAAGVAVYPETILREMAKRGSLLLWHLKLEGRTLFERDGFASHLLATLGSFDSFTEECDEYAGLLDDVESSLKDGVGITELDLHVLQVVARNACILLSYASGCPTFGRMSAAQVAMGLLPELELDWARYELLTRWHLTYTRGSKAPGDLPSDQEMLDYVSMVRELLATVRKAVC